MRAKSPAGPAPGSPSRATRAARRPRRPRARSCPRRPRAAAVRPTTGFVSWAVPTKRNGEHAMRPRVLGLALVGWLALAAAPASAQTPATCNANLFDEAIARDKDLTAPGEIVNYRVALVNRSVTNALIGCNVEHVTANFRCPGPTGQPDGPTTNLVTDVDIPSNDSVRFFGPFACTMPD